MVFVGMSLFFAEIIYPYLRISHPLKMMWIRTIIPGITNFWYTCLV